MANKNDRFKVMSRDSQAYSDFTTDLTPHPVSLDIVKFTNENSVIRTIRNLLLTDRNERLYQPNIGTNIRKMLFEPINSMTAQTITDFIRDTVFDFEPRARLLSVNVVPDEENNRYVVNVTIMVINKQEPTSFNIALDRIR
jgi:phage baseplate assembly protein W